jgi:hypothetical protein
VPFALSHDDLMGMVRASSVIDCVIVVRAFDDPLFVNGAIGRQQRDLVGRHALNLRPCLARCH